MTRRRRTAPPCSGGDRQPQRAGAGEQQQDGGVPATQRAASRSRPPGCAWPRGARPWSPCAGQDGGDDGDGQPGRDADQDRCRGEAERRGRVVRAQAREELAQAQRDAEARAEAEQRRQQAEHRRLAEHGAEDLAARGADAAQQRELPAALGHEDGEGVVDDERRHQQGDPAEQQEHGVELAGLAGDLFGGALAQLVAGAHGDGAAEGLGRVAPQRRLADAVPGDQVDAVVAARAEEPPQGLGRDRGHAAVLVVQEGGAKTRVDGADERERLDPPLGGDPHAVALAQAELLGGGRVDGDLAGGRGQPPAGRVLPAQPRVGRDGDAERPLPRSGAWGRPSRSRMRTRGAGHARGSATGRRPGYRAVGVVAPSSSSRPASRAVDAAARQKRTPAPPAREAVCLRRCATRPVSP